MSLVRRAIGLAKSKAAIYLGGSVLARLGAIVLIPIYTRRLEPAEYGTYGLTASVLSFLPLFFAVSMSAGLTKAYFDTPKEEDPDPAVGAVAKGLVAVSSTLALSTAAVVWLAFPQGGFGFTQGQMWLITGSSWAYAVGMIPDTYLRAKQAAWKAAALSLGQFLTTAFLGVYLVVLRGWGLSGAIAAMCAASFPMGLYGLWLAARLGGTDVVARTRRALSLSVPFVPHAIASWAQEQGDRWILEAYDPTRLGPYYLAGQLSSPLPMVSSSWNSAEAARMGETMRDGGIRAVVATLRSHYVRYAGVTGAFAAALLLASPVLPLVIGQKYLVAVMVLPALAVVHVLDAVYYPGANFVLYAGKPRWIPVVTVASGLSGLVLAYVLLRLLGLPGLLLARITTSLVRSGLLFALSRKLARAA